MRQRKKGCVEIRKQTMGRSIADKEKEKALETGNQSLRPHKHDICHNGSRLLLTVSAG